MHLEFFFSEKENNSQVCHCNTALTIKTFFFNIYNIYAKYMGKHAFQQHFNVGTLCQLCLVNLKINKCLL